MIMIPETIIFIIISLPKVSLIPEKLRTIFGETELLKILQPKMNAQSSQKGCQSMETMIAVESSG